MTTTASLYKISVLDKSSGYNSKIKPNSVCYQIQPGFEQKSAQTLEYNTKTSIARQYYWYLLSLDVGDTET